MSLGSYSRGALAEVDATDVERMLALDETLFVEHKRDLGGAAYQLAKSVGAFANTLGGWVLLGVKNGRPYGSKEPWAQDDGPNLVDSVRDNLRGRLDPLPAFEARRFSLAGGPVGVLRVYESADTPHVHLDSGAVFVREAAGDTDVAKARRPGPGAQGERRYQASAIRSQAQLVQLAERGRIAEERVRALVEPDRRLPLVENGLGLRHHEIGMADPENGAGIFVRLMPYTLPSRFRGWSTTAHAAASVLATAEVLSGVVGLDRSHVQPQPAGAFVSIGYGFPPARHTAGFGLRHGVRVMLDGIGLVGAATVIECSKEGRRTWIEPDDLVTKYIAPTIRAAAQLLRAGESLGRAYCQIDLTNIGLALMVEGTDGNSPAHVPCAGDVVVPADETEITRAATLAAYALARGSGAPMYDPPAGSH